MRVNCLIGACRLDRVAYGLEQVDDQCMFEHAGAWTGPHLAYRRAAVMVTVMKLAFKSRNVSGSSNESKPAAFVA